MKKNILSVLLILVAVAGFADIDGAGRDSWDSSEWNGNVYERDIEYTIQGTASGGNVSSYQLRKTFKFKYHFGSENSFSNSIDEEYYNHSFELAGNRYSHSIEDISLPSGCTYSGKTIDIGTDYNGEYLSETYSWSIKEDLKMSYYDNHVLKVVVTTYMWSNKLKIAYIYNRTGTNRAITQTQYSEIFNINIPNPRSISQYSYTKSYKQKISYPSTTLNNLFNISYRMAHFGDTWTDGKGGIFLENNDFKKIFSISPGTVGGQCAITINKVSDTEYRYIYTITYQPGGTVDSTTYRYIFRVVYNADNEIYIRVYNPPYLSTSVNSKYLIDEFTIDVGVENPIPVKTDISHITAEGDWVAYVEDDGFDEEIIIKNLRTGGRWTTDNDGPDDDYPYIKGDLLVWVREYLSGSKICVLDLDALVLGEESIDCSWMTNGYNNVSDPHTDGTGVVWVWEKSDETSEIYYQRPGDSSKYQDPNFFNGSSISYKISYIDELKNSHPRIDNQIVVWQVDGEVDISPSDSTTDSEIAIYNIETLEEYITYNNYPDIMPEISDGKVYWLQRDPVNDSDVVIWDIASGEKKFIDPMPWTYKIGSPHKVAESSDMDFSPSFTHNNDVDMMALVRQQADDQCVLVCDVTNIASPSCILTFDSEDYDDCEPYFDGKDLVWTTYSTSNSINSEIHLYSFYPDFEEVIEELDSIKGTRFCLPSIRNGVLMYYQLKPESGNPDNRSIIFNDLIMPTINTFEVVPQGTTHIEEEDEGENIWTKSGVEVTVQCSDNFDLALSDLSMSVNNSAYIDFASLAQNYSGSFEVESDVNPKNEFSFFIGSSAVSSIALKVRDNFDQPNNSTGIDIFIDKTPPEINLMPNFDEVSGKDYIYYMDEANDKLYTKDAFTLDFNGCFSDPGGCGVDLDTIKYILIDNYDENKTQDNQAWRDFIIDGKTAEFSKNEDYYFIVSDNLGNTTSPYSYSVSGIDKEPPVCNWISFSTEDNGGSKFTPASGEEINIDNEGVSYLNQVRVTSAWSDPGAGISSYKVERYIGNDSWEDFDVDDKLQFNVSDNGQYRILVTDHLGQVVEDGNVRFKITCIDNGKPVSGDLKVKTGENNYTTIGVSNHGLCFKSGEEKTIVLEASDDLAGVDTIKYLLFDPEEITQETVLETAYNNKISATVIPKSLSYVNGMWTGTIDDNGIAVFQLTDKTETDPNKAYCSYTIDIYDNTPPVFSSDIVFSKDEILSPGEECLITVTSDDDEAVYSWEFFKDDQDQSPVQTGTGNIASVTGNGYLHFRAEDHVGNSATREVTVDLYDDDAPQITSFNLLNGDYYSNTMEGLDIEVKDGNSGNNDFYNTDDENIVYTISYYIACNSPGNPGWTEYDSDVSIDLSWIPVDGNYTIELKAMDEHGNISQSKTAQFLCDRTGPEITDSNFNLNLNFSQREELTGWNNFVRIDSIPESTFSDEMGLDVTLHYYINGTEAATIPGDGYIDVLFVDENGDDIEITEGTNENTLKVMASDSLGNYGETAILDSEEDFIVDKTPPVVSDYGVAVSLNGQTVSEQESIPENHADVTVIVPDGSETLMYKVCVLQEMTDTPDFSDKVLRNSHFQLNNLANGVSFVYIQGVDSAGNTSEESLVRIISVDTNVPEKPAITGINIHPAAVPEDAVPNQNPQFNINIDKSSDSGIDYYQYRLWKGYSVSDSPSVDDVPFINTNGDVSFTGLEDNLELEYYYLEARAVSGSGKAGKIAVFPFRIDTNPPQNLTLLSGSHQNSSVVYNNNELVLNWLKPLEMTGVQSYELKAMLFDGNGTILTDAIGYERSEIDQNGWIMLGDEISSTDWIRSCSIGVSENYIQINMFKLMTALGMDGIKEGFLIFAVKAVDAVGLISYSEKAVQFDCVPPGLDPFSETGNQITFPEPNNNSAVIIDWSSMITDPAADGYALSLSWADGETGKVLLDGSATSYQFNGLLPEVQYTVKLTAMDNAVKANTVSRTINFYLNGSVEVELQQPYYEQLAGYELSGTYTPGQANQDDAVISISIPPQLTIIADGQEEALEQITIQDNVIFDSDMYESGNAAGPFEMTFNGFSFTVQSLRFTRSEGLVFENAAYLPEFSEGTELVYSEINLPSATSTFFSGDDSDILAEEDAFSAQSVGSEAENSWKIDDITRTSLVSKYWSAVNGSVDTSAMPVVLQSLQDEVYSDVIAVNDARLKSDGSFVSAEPAETVYLTLAGGSVISAWAAGLEADAVLVDAGSFIFNNSFSFYNGEGGETTLDVHNVRAFTDNTVKPYNAVISDTYIHFEEKGIRYCITGLSITVDGRVYLNGYAEYGSYENGVFTVNEEAPDGPVFTELEITDEPEPGNPAVISSYEIELFGFPFTIDNGYFEDGNFDVTTGSLNLSYLKPGSVVTINGLVVAASDYSVIQASDSSEGSFSFTPDAYYASSGETLTVEDIKIDTTGVYAGTASFKISSSFDIDNLPVTDLPLYADSRQIGDSSSYQQNVYSTAAGFACALSGISYSGGKVYAGSVAVTLPEPYAGSVISITGSSFTPAGWTSGTSAEAVQITSYDWQISYNNIALDDNGLTGAGTVQAGEAFGDAEFSFPAFRMFADGTIDSGTGYSLDNAEQYLLLGGWMMEINNYRLNEADLEIGNADLHIPDMLGSGIMRFTDVIVTAGGELVTNGEYAQTANPPVLTSYNNFPVTVLNAEIGEKSIFMSGDFGLPEKLETEAIRIGSEEEMPVEFDADGFIVSPWQQETLTFGYCGFEVTTNEYRFGRAGFEIKDNTIDWGSGEPLALPDIGFYADGNVKYNTPNENELLDVQLAGFEFSVVNAQLNDNGLQLKSYIKLPEMFGDVSIYFNDLTVSIINGKVQVTSSVYVPVIEFDAFDCHFKFSDIFWDNGGFFLGEAVLTLPETLDSVQITLENVTIGSDGSFTLGKLSADPFDLWGLTFHLSHLSFANDTIEFMGSVTFNDEFGIDALTGRTVSIKEFTHNFSTGDTTFDLAVDQLELPMPGGFTVRMLDLGISTTEIYAQTAEILFPEDWLPYLSVDSVGATGISVSLEDGSFDFESIYANDIVANCEGFEFTISSISYTKTDGFVLVGSFPLDGIFKGEETPPVINVKRLQINPDFTLGDLEAEAVLTNLKFSEHLLYTGNVGVAKNDEQFEITMGGKFTTTSAFPVEDLRNVSLQIGGDDPNNPQPVRFDMNTLRFTHLEAHFHADEFSLMGLNLENMNIGFAYGDDMPAPKFAVGSTVIIPESIPGFGGLAPEFYVEIDLDKGIEDLDFGLTLEEDKEFITGVIVKKDSSLQGDLEIDDNDKKIFILRILNGEFEFTEDFAVPELANTSVAIDEFEVDSRGNINKCSAEYSLGEQFTITGGMIIENGSIYAKMHTNGKDVIFGIGGTVVIPQSVLKSEDGSIKIALTKCEVGTNGDLDLDISTTVTNLRLIDNITLETGTLRLYSGKNEEGRQDFRVGLIDTTLRLDDSLPAGLAGMGLTVNVFEYSTVEGIVDFSATLEGNQSTSITIFSGIKARLDSLTIDMDGVACTADVIIPRGTLGLDTQITVETTLGVTWGGDITNLDFILEEMALNVFGFGITVENMQFTQDGMSCERAVLTLPAVLNGNAVALTNITVDKELNFNCGFELDTLSFDIAGTHLEMEKPDFDHKIAFERVLFKLPTALGGAELEVEGFSISPSGIEVEGGRFELPEFSVAGGLRFSDVFVAYQNDGYNYTIGGGGKVFIPEMGELEAGILFTNVSEDYPIGLKYAEFSFRVEGIGLPIGTTGVFVNGIAGALAFGPPGEEMCEYLRTKFSAGMRIKFELSLQDAPGSIKARPGFWVNVETFDFAVYGSFEFLYGLITADTMVSITRIWGFEAIASVDVGIWDHKFGIIGNARIHIWDDNGAKLCGAVSASFYISKKAFFNWLPTRKITLGPIGVEFGDFHDGKKGVKGYVDTKIPLVGTIGFFAGPHEFHLGGVSQYVLLDETAALEGYNCYAMAGDGLYMESPKALDLRFLDGKSGTFRKEYSFSVPGKTVTSPDKIKAERYYLPGEEMSAGPDSASIEEVEFESNLERLIFGINFDVGDPVISAIAPDGEIFDETSDGVIIFRDVDLIAIAVMNPMGGTWTLDIENLPADAEYNVQVWGKGDLPDASFGLMQEEADELNQIAAAGSGDIKIISGRFSAFTDEQPSVAVYLTRHKDSFDGEYLGDAQISDNGIFSYSLDKSGLKDGVYYAYVGVCDGINPERFIMDETPITVENYAALSAVTDFHVSVSGGGTVEMFFEDPNGKRTVGYNLYIDDGAALEPVKQNLGMIKNFELSGFNAGQEYTFTIVPYDADIKEGAESEAVTVRIDESSASTLNSFSADNTMQLEYPINTNVEIILPLTVNDPVITGSAQDYADISVVSMPEWMFCIIPDQVISLVNGTSVFSANIYSNTRPEPGTYELALRAENMGNRDLAQDITIQVEVVYPQPAINMLSPEGWHSLDETVLEITGTGMLEESRVFIDNIEYEDTELTKTGITLTVQAGLEGGTHNIRVENPGNLSDSTIFEIVAPSYAVLAYKIYGQAYSGQQTDFFIGIAGKNRFEGSAVFDIEHAPEGWNVYLVDRYVEEGEIGVVRIEIPEATEAGLYSVGVLCDLGSAFDLDVEVIDDAATVILPHISSLSDASAIAGTEIDIFGYGFGDGGTLYVNSIETAVTGWSKDRISFILPAGVGTVEIMVVSDGNESNVVEIEIQDKQFNIYLDTEEIFSEAGEEVSFGINIYGTVQNVGLSAECDSDEITATVDHTMVDCGTNAVVSVIPSANCQEGIYTVTIKAEFEGVEKTKTVALTIGQPLVFVSENLAEAIKGQQYSEELETANSAGEASYSIAAGYLPAGIEMSIDGVFSGIPVKAGDYTFIVEARDTYQRTVQQQFTITVQDNIWAGDKWNSSRTGWNPVPGPAEDNTSWNWKAPEGIRQIVSCSDRVFMALEDRVAALEYPSGQLIYLLTVTPEKIRYFNETLVVETAQGSLELYNTALGAKVSTVADVEWWGIVDNSLEYICKDGTASSALALKLTGSICASENGLIAYADGSDIYAGTGTGTMQKLYTLAAEAADIALLNQTVYALDKNGNVSVIGITGTVYATFGTVHQNGTLVTNGNIAAVYSEAGISVRSIQQDKLIYDELRTVNKAIISGDYLYYSLDNRMICINTYKGSEIWSVDALSAELMSMQGKLYTAESDGRITCYNGSYNPSGPDSTLHVTPYTADGDNDWYVTQPELLIDAVDAETYTAGYNYRINNGEWNSCDKKITPEEGILLIEAYAFDSEGKDGNIVSYTSKYDATVPEAEITLSGETNENGIYIQPPLMTLSADDKVSGVAWIQYSLDRENWHKYSGAVQLPHAVDQSVYYRACDLAGNISETKIITYTSDVTAPTITHYEQVYIGTTVITLTANDDIGVKTIQYAINGGPAQDYERPIPLTEGEWDIAYQAADFAGNKSGWKTAHISVAPLSGSEWITDLDFDNCLHRREIVRNVQPGNHIYLPSHGRHNRFVSLPDYLKGADYIRTHVEDKKFGGDSFIEFTAGIDLDVYLAVHENCMSDLSSWILIEENVRIEDRVYFKKGAAIYKKSAAAGSRVHIPGPAIRGRGAGTLVFAVPAAANQLAVDGPEEELVPFENYNFSLYTTLTPEDEPLWSWRTGEEEWTQFASGYDVSFNAPYFDKDTMIEIKIAVNNAGEEIVKTMEALVANKSAINILSPAPGMEVLKGSVCMPYAEALDMYGNKTNCEIYYKLDTFPEDMDWQKAGAEIIIDAEAEVLNLKAVAADSEQTTIEATASCKCVESYSPLLIDFTSNNVPLFADGGEPAAGLLDDEMSVITGVQIHKTEGWGWRKHTRIVYDKALVMDDENTFRIHTGNGRMKVKIKIGPTAWWLEQSITVNGEKIIIPKTYGQDMFELECEVTVSDAYIDIGTESWPPLLEIEVLPMGESDMTVITEVTPLYGQWATLFGTPGHGHDNKKKNNGWGW